MKTWGSLLKTLFVGLLVIIFVGMSFARESTLSPLEASNLKQALYCMDILENRPDLEASIRIDTLRNECFLESYIQHAPHVPDGRDAVLALFSDRYGKHQETSVAIKRTASKGDLVWIHMHFKRAPDDLGRAIVHIFRMENGKIAEHWGVSQAVPEESKNNNTMF